MNTKWVEDSALRPDMKHFLTHFTAFCVSLTSQCCIENPGKQLLLLNSEGAQSYIRLGGCYSWSNSFPYLTISHNGLCSHVVNHIKCSAQSFLQSKQLLIYL